MSDGLTPALRRALVAVCGEDGVFDDATHRRVYEGDAYAFDAVPPAAVVLPRTQDEVREVVRRCVEHGVAFAPRGAGTGLSGGCLALRGGVQIGMARLRRILEIDPLDRCARVEAGVVNAELDAASAVHGLGFAPDPSSQIACTVGGNFAENAGGPHTLKYGVTLPHVLGARIVTPEGEWLRLGGRHAAGPGIDLLALQCGAEGTLGIVTELTVRLSPRPRAVRTFLAVFESIGEAARTVSELVRRGTVPAAMELIDRVMLDALEQAFGLGLPTDAGAVLLIEVDGEADVVQADAHAVRDVCAQQNAREVREAVDAEERSMLWRARKHAFGAVGRISPDYATQDVVVPRAAIPAIVDFIGETARHWQLTIGTVIHAGDGNLHPAVLYDRADPELVRRALGAVGDIVARCLELGGSPTGEHGIGLEKRHTLPALFGPADLDAMRAVRRVLDPYDLCNPDKVLPAPAGCGETRALARAPEGS